MSDQRPNEEAPSVKDRNDGLLRLADFRMRRITSRRDHEWKVTVALWALLAAGIAKPQASLGQHWFLFGVGLALLVYGHARWWVMSHWRESRMDSLYSLRYADEAGVLLGVPSGRPTIALPPDLGPYTARCWGQVATTALLAFFAWLAALK
jgi:hypothetical protein